MATATASRTPAEPTLMEPLRLSGADLRALVESSREAATARRAEFLAQNPAYIECVVASCTGLVGPRFVRTTPDALTRAG